ncbi:MAG: hypothetical protein ACKV2T_39265 [Kofleriaceae bacterium]
MLRPMIVVALLAGPAFAQQPQPVCPVGETCKVAAPKTVPKQRATPRYDMDKIDVNAKDRKVMLITFLERASEELERASLQKRSFIPDLVKTIDAETL